MGWVSRTTVSSGPPVIAGAFTTLFPLTENPISQGGKWDGGAAVGLDWLNFKTASGVACAGGASSSSPPPFNDSLAVLRSSVIALAADQYVSWIIHKAPGYTPPGTHELGGLLRFQLGPNVARGYEYYCGATGSSTLIRWNGPLNNFSTMGTTGPGPVSPSDGDIMLFTAVGAVLTAYQNGSMVWTATDATWATGQGGLQSYAESTSTPTSYGMSAVTIGNM